MWAAREMPASCWVRVDRAARANIQRADPDTLSEAEVSSLLGDLWALPTDLIGNVVLQLPSSTDVVMLARASSWWRRAVWHALARHQLQLRAAASLFPCLHKGVVKQLRWPHRIDDVAQEVLRYQPWLARVSWDDFKAVQARIAAFLPLDARPALEPVVCPEDLLQSSLPELSDFVFSVRLLHDGTIIGSYDGPLTFTLRNGWSQEASFNLYALESFASNDVGNGGPRLMPYDRSRCVYLSRYGPDVKPYPVNAIVHRVYKEDDDPLYLTFSKLRAVAFISLGAKMVRVLDSTTLDEDDCSTCFRAYQEPPTALLRAEHVAPEALNEADLPAEFPDDPASVGPWDLETTLFLEESCPECFGEVKLSIWLKDGTGNDWSPNALFLRRLFSAQLGVGSEPDA